MANGIDMSKREENKRRTRDLIYETGMGLFVERGYNGVTMADIADAAGVARATVFNHFGAKENILLDYSRRQHEHIAAFAAALPADAATYDALRGTLTEDLRRTLELRAYGKVVRRFVPQSEDAERERAGNRLATTKLYEDRIAAGIESGEVSGDVDAAEAARTIVAMYFYVIDQALVWNMPDDEAFRHLQHSFDFLWFGISSGHTPPDVTS